jgi:hypothetical protein
MFHWAHRLDPSRAEPLYARWVAFWLKDIGRFEDYLDDNPQVPFVTRSRGRRQFVPARDCSGNPLVPRPLVAWLFNALPRIMGRQSRDTGLASRIRSSSTNSRRRTSVS